MGSRCWGTGSGGADVLEGNRGGRPVTGKHLNVQTDFAQLSSEVGALNEPLRCEGSVGWLVMKYLASFDLVRHDFSMLWL